MLPTAESLPVREAAKAVTYYEQDDDRTFVFVSGQSGRLNLLGGGIDQGESPSEARYREIQEEVGAQALKAVLHDTYLGFVDGEVTDGPTKQHKIAHWIVSALELQPDTELVAGDIESIHRLTYEEAMNHPMMSHMAKAALDLFALFYMDDKTRLELNSTAA